MTIFLQAFLEGFTGGNLLSWAEMPGAANQVFADENSDDPQTELMKSLLKDQDAEEQQRKNVVLVERTRAGDSGAFEQLIRQYEPQIFRMAQQITQNREEAEDATQEAFLKAYQNLDQFQGHPKFFTWLARIAINESLVRVRKRERGKAVPIDGDLPMEEVSIPREVADYSMSLWLSQAVQDARVAFEAFPEMPPVSVTTSKMESIRLFLKALRKLEQETHGT